MTKPSNICLHAWHKMPNGHLEYTDRPEEIDGWCVYSSFEDEEGNYIDGPDEEMDFPDYEAALAEGLRRAAEHGVNLQEY